MSAVAVPTWSERVVHALARLGRGVDPGRRTFLQRAALVATALTVNPFDFILKPVSAYASVCGSGNECSDGWSAFCCTINDGKNTCPPGSYAAGWWKVNDSAFCRGKSRYYIDCNKHPKTGTCTCDCATGSCDRRRTCCNNFRYGQCNQQIKGTTPVVCRVITCMPPWEWDRSCTKTVLRSPATRTHSAPCLPGEWPSLIEIKYQDMGLAGSVLGRPTGPEVKTADGRGRRRPYETGLIVWLRGTGTAEVHAAIAARYAALGEEMGPLGYPIRDHGPVGDGRGRWARFEHGAIYATHEHGAFETQKAFFRAYRRAGGPTGKLGYPVTGRDPVGDGRGHTTRFEGGRILRSPQTGARVLKGPVARRYEKLGGPPGAHDLGYPLTGTRKLDGGGRIVLFENGRITWRRGVGARAVWGPIHDRYVALGAQDGVLGLPRTDVRAMGDGRGERCLFQRGTIWWSPETGAHMVRGAVRRRYREEGGPTGWLGYPVNDQEVADGVATCDFEHGAISYVRATGLFEVIRR